VKHLGMADAPRPVQTKRYEAVAENERSGVTPSKPDSFGDAEFVE
jgi:hypothetical protein